MTKQRKGAVLKVPFTHPILIGEGALSSLPSLLTGRRSKKVFILADQRLKSARKLILQTLKSAGFDAVEIPVPAGEKLKDIQSVYPIYESLLSEKADRDSLLIALGGGTIGDVGGFIASTYLRGIDWIGVPTTLLAQVDSSVGGKTGINHKAGKNLIGTFHQPKAVICDTRFLKTLGRQEIISGIGEISKVALTFDPPFFSFLEKNLPALLKLDSKVAAKCIQKALQWKCVAVQKDEFDRKGVREVLNFGHTFGHALESATQYKKFQHGEAVIWGMRFAVALSEIRGHLSSKDRAQIDRFLRCLPVGSFLKFAKRDQIFPYMKKDKKSEAGSIRFVLLSRLGKSISDRKVTPADLNQAYELMLENSHEK